MKVLERLGLWFGEPDLERAFRDDYVLRGLALNRPALLFAGVLFYGFFLWDKAVDPRDWEFGHAVRGLVVLPLLWGGSALLGLKAVQQRMEALVVVLGVGCVASLSVIYYRLAHGYDFGVQGPMLVAIWVFSIFQVRLLYLVLFSVLTTGIFFAGQFAAANAREGMLLVNMMSLLTALALGMWAATLRELSQREKFLTLRELRDARSRIEELLHSMLPAEIVGRIQAGETNIADAYGEVSIVFADLVGFTELSRRISPGHLVEILNRCFTEFDARAERYGLERIKTIGDAYMAVGGLTRGLGGEDHARSAGAFAVELQAVVRQLSVELGYPINARVGLHIGPVVAGVIGTKRPAFDCWGEAVNLASRLEGIARPGSVIISESAYWRLKPFFPISVLDDVDLKGIGPTRVYLLEPAA